MRGRRDRFYNKKCRSFRFELPRDENPDLSHITEKALLIFTAAGQRKQKPDMDLFSTLPTEILLQILNNSPDFLTLHHLLSASPRAYRIFDQHAADIIEHVLATYQGTSFGLHKFFRLVAQTRTMKTRLDVHMWITYCKSSLRGEKDSWSDLSRLGLDATILRQTVRTAADIQKLSCACFDRWDFLLGLMFRKQVRAGEIDPMYDPTPAARPWSWMEEYRVHRSLWYLQLVWDIHLKMDRQIERLEELLGLLGIEDNWLVEEFRTIWECLYHITMSSKKYRYGRDPWNPRPIASSRLYVMQPKIWEMPPVPDNSGRDLFSSRPPSWVNLAGAGNYIWRSTIDIYRSTDLPDHQRAWSALRRVGIWIYDKERIAALRMDIEERNDSGEPTEVERERLKQRWWKVTRIVNGMC